MQLITRETSVAALQDQPVMGMQHALGWKEFLAATLDLERQPAGDPAGADAKHVCRPLGERLLVGIRDSTRASISPSRLGETGTFVITLIPQIWVKNRYAKDDAERPSSDHLKGPRVPLTAADAHRNNTSPKTVPTHRTRRVALHQPH